MARSVGFGDTRFATWLGVTWFAISVCGCTVDQTATAPAQPAPPQAGSTPIPPVAGSASVPAPPSTVTSAPTAPAQPVAGAPASAPVANSAGAGTGVSGSAAPAPGAVTPPPAVPVASVTIALPNVEPGGEETQCAQIRLKNTEPLSVVRLHNRLTSGSHHFILTALNDPNAPEQAPTRCQGFGGAVTGAPLVITQKHDDIVELPEGVGYRLKAGQVMHLEMHYINTTDEPLDISATADMFAAEPGAQLQEAAVLLVGTADFVIPPNARLETEPKFLALPAGMEGTKFYAITGHTHRFGTEVNVSLASASMAPLMELYAPQNFDWEAPDTKQLEPHLTVPTGGGFFLNCAWDNTSDIEASWGESANDEMCFFWGYYYPRKEDVFSIVVDNIDQETLRTVASRPPPAP
jgi:Copper type II ascorbate-dependent monooxygenase, C-terminal domain